MKKLIQTNFSYMDRHGDKPIIGSYLGRKRATTRTLRKFLRTNAGYCQLAANDFALRSIDSSFESQWIRK